MKIKTICDADATRENILAAKEFLAKSEIDDQAVVFFAGHGLLDAKNNYYFGTTDIDVKNPAARGVTFQEIEGLLDEIPARCRLPLIDTCHSGEVDREPAATAIVGSKPAEKFSQPHIADTAEFKPNLPADAKLWAPAESIWAKTIQNA